MTRNTKRLIFFILALCAVLILTVSVLGAYVGRGIKKGVLVATSYYFESDLLGNISGTENADVDKVSAICEQSAGSNTEGETVKAINIRNYRSLAFNTFDVYYNCRIWLSSPDDADYDIYFSTNQEADWTKTEATEYGNATPVSSVLTGGDVYYDTIYIKWIWTGTGAEDISKAKNVYVVAEPTSPEYLTSKKLGAVLSVGEFEQINSYSIQKGFFKPAIFFDGEADYTGSLKNYAGFTYRITVTGTPPTGKQVRVSWNPDKLELLEDIASEDGIEITKPEIGYSYITITLEANRTYNMVFFRNTGAGKWDRASDDSRADNPPYYNIYNNTVDSYVKFYELY